MYGTPGVISTDNGSCFVSNIFKALCISYGISHKLSSSLKPSTQGGVERTNRSMLSVLRAYTNTKQTDWDIFIPAAAFALNSTESYALKYSPFVLVFGRSPTLPPDMTKLNPLQFSRPVIDHLVSILQTQEQVQKIAQENFAHTQQLMKARYDKKATDIPLKTGDIVWLHVPRLRQQRTKLKLQPTFQGPYLLVRFTTKTTVILKRMSDGKFIIKPVTVCRLKKVTMRDENTQTNKVRQTQNANPHPDAPQDQTNNDRQQRPVPVPNCQTQDEVKTTQNRAEINISQPAARKFRESDVFHSIEKIIQASQTDGTPVRILIRFTDLEERWLPLECLNRPAMELYRKLDLKVNKVRNLRSRQ